MNEQKIIEVMEKALNEIIGFTVSERIDGVARNCLASVAKLRASPAQPDALVKLLERIVICLGYTDMVPHADMRKVNEALEVYERTVGK